MDQKLIEPCFTVFSLRGIFSPTFLGLVSVLTDFTRAIIFFNSSVFAALDSFEVLSSLVDIPDIF